MQEKLNNFLRLLEQKLINAGSRDEAYSLVKNYDKESLLVIQDYLKAHTRSKNRHAIIASIVRCTYELSNNRKTVTRIDAEM